MSTQKAGSTGEQTTTTGAKLLAERIVARGAGTVFALAGAAHAPLLYALDERGVTIVGGRHESGTVGAADGYARASGRIGFALIIAEQGIPNAMSGIRTAHDAGSPVVVITCRHPDRWIEPAGELVVDHHEMVASTTKFRKSVPSVDLLGAYFDAACKAASEGTPGVAVLILPSTMLVADVAATSSPEEVPIATPAADADAIDRAAAMIGQAERPIVIVDAAAARADAGPALRRLSEATGLPVLGNSLGRGLVPEVAPHGYSWPYAQIAAVKADVVLVIGAQLDMRYGFGRPPRFAADARFIHIAAEPQDIGRNRPVALPILADPAKATAQLADRLAAMQWNTDPAWLGEALAERDQFTSEIAARTSGPLHPIDIGAVVEERAPQDRITVGDGADIVNFTYAKLRIHSERGYADHAPLGSMGMGLALALGMAAAERERAGDAARPTIYITGDGSLGFLMAELDTARRAGLKLITLVSNDGMWGTEFHGQELAYGRAINTLLEGCDYAQVARGLGLEGYRVTTRDELRDAFDRALAADGPSLLDVQIDPTSGRGRKTDARLAMIIFDDIPRKKD